MMCVGSDTSGVNPVQRWIFGAIPQGSQPTPAAAGASTTPGATAASAVLKARPKGAAQPAGGGGDVQGLLTPAFFTDSTGYKALTGQ